jgi:hypothetical protein
VILLRVLARTTTISGVLIADHDRFPTYYGPEFTGRVLDQWAYERGVKLQFIEPGKPIQNACKESDELGHRAHRLASKTGAGQRGATRSDLGSKT